MLTQLNDVDDPRDQARTKYESKVILFTRIMGAIFMFDSMRKIGSCFEDENVIQKVSEMLNLPELEKFPHRDTINNYLKQLDPKELEAIVQKLAIGLIKMPIFRNQQYRNCWQILIDGTKLFSIDEKNSEGALFKVHRDQDKNIVSVEYYFYVLEAKLLLQNDIVISVCSIFVENEEGISPYDEVVEKSEEKKKQDCELMAFYRMEKELKRLFGNTCLCLTMDSLYACERVFKICKDNNWRYIIRFKEGSIKSIAKEFDRTAEEAGKQWRMYGSVSDNGGKEKYEYLNGIKYRNQFLNMVRYTVDGKKHSFDFLTNFPINKKNCSYFVVRARARWKIENQGFNNQKNHGYALTHKFSFNKNAIKNHYLLIQLAHAILQLFENVGELKELKLTLYEIHFYILLKFMHPNSCDQDVRIEPGLG